MRRALPLSSAIAVFMLVASTAAAATPAPSGGTPAAPYVPGEVIVQYRDGASGGTIAGVEQRTGTSTATPLPGGSREVSIADGQSVRATLSELRRNPNVAYAVPNYVARAALSPNDPGFRKQWQFYDAFGIGMPAAWSRARGWGAPGGRGAVVAVLDSGVAYETRGHYVRAPDLAKTAFVKGYDFVDHDRHPNDEEGHGTHIAGAIAEQTNNRRSAAGIAYRAKIMPVRVLDSGGEGDAGTISRAIRWAAKRRVDVINLSIEFAARVQADEIPSVLSAIRYARRRGSVIVAAAGKQADVLRAQDKPPTVTYPARAERVIAVGSTTRSGCQADYSNGGPGIDLMAPGGGANAPNFDNPQELATCKSQPEGSYILQETFTCLPLSLRSSCFKRFGLPRRYYGTSMSAAQVSGVAAMVIASGKLGRNPKPLAVQELLQGTARELGTPGYDERYGFGLLDAAAALAR